MNQEHQQKLQSSNVRVHRSGKRSVALDSRVHLSGIVTGMTCVTTIIKQVEPKTSIKIGIIQIYMKG